MKRLEIVLIGHSQAMSELSAELDAHGHLIHHLRDEATLELSEVNDASVFIEDGTLDVPHAGLDAFEAAVHLGLRVSLTPVGERALPELDLVCWLGTATAQRLIARHAVVATSSGNGCVLRDAAVATLVDNVAMLVSRFSRDTEISSAPSTLTRHRVNARKACCGWTDWPSSIASTAPKTPNC